MNKKLALSLNLKFHLVYDVLLLYSENFGDYIDPFYLIELEY